MVAGAVEEGEEVDGVCGGEGVFEGEARVVGGVGEEWDC